MDINQEVGSPATVFSPVFWECPGFLSSMVYSSIISGSHFPLLP